MTALPQGFTSFVTNIGIKDATDDFTLVCADSVVAASAVFTQSRFAGPSVVVSRKHVANHLAKEGNIFGDIGIFTRLERLVSCCFQRVKFGDCFIYGGLCLELVC